MLNSKQTEFLRHAALAAVACERATQLPAELTLAQAVLESGWGAHAPNNNCFGVKFARRHSGSQVLSTYEVIRRDRMEPGDVVLRELPDGRVRVRGKRRFAAFSSLAECFEDHALLITTGAPYGAAWNSFRALRDTSQLIRDVAQEYATDPRYADALARILAMSAVQTALSDARSSV